MDTKPQSAEDTAKLAEEKAEHARASSMRFKQTLLAGMGSSLLFGLVSAVCLKLVPMAMQATTFAAAVGPLTGLLAVAAVGVSFLYLGSRLLSNIITLEQEGQARKIQEAKAKGKGKDVEIPVLQTDRGKTGMLPGFNTPSTETDKDKAPAADAQTAPAPSMQIEASSVQLLDKPVTRDAVAPAKEEGWAARTATDTAQAVQAGI